MKKQTMTNGKRAAANDKPENGKAEKAPKAPKPEEKFTLGSIDKVKRGFLLEFVKFVKAKGTVDTDALVKEFVGRPLPQVPRAKRANLGLECLAVTAFVGG